MNRLTATLLSAPILLLVGGGCGTTTYDSDTAMAPLVTDPPRPRPSTEKGNFTSVGGSLREVFIDVPSKLYDSLFGRTAVTDARDIESDQPDRRRTGIVELTDRSFGKAPPYTTRYAQIARFDDSPLVRATALRSLNRARDASAGDLFVASLSDESPLVRLEAAKALANMPNPSAAPTLLKLFDDPKEDLDVRIAAADGLRYTKTLEVARALIDQLQAQAFGLSWQSRRSLQAMTGRDYHYDQSAWLDLLSSPQSPIG